MDRHSTHTMHTTPCGGPGQPRLSGIATGHGTPQGAVMIGGAS